VTAKLRHEKNPGSPKRKRWDRPDGLRNLGSLSRSTSGRAHAVARSRRAVPISPSIESRRSGTTPVEVLSMAKTKKTMAQQAIGLAAPMLPAPVAKVAGSRWGSRLLILLLPFLFATGVLTISWNNGIPTVNFDRAKALLVGQQVGERVQQEAVRVAQDVRERQGIAGPQTAGMQPVATQPASTQSQWGQAQPTSWQGQPASQQSYQPQRQQQSFQQPGYQQPGYQQPAYQQPQPAAPQWGPPAYR
jgi:hypothetical protein